MTMTFISKSTCTSVPSAYEPQNYCNVYATKHGCILIPIDARTMSADDLGSLSDLSNFLNSEILAFKFRN
jgi:hypothetical protein